jgi:hypothetical protein
MGEMGANVLQKRMEEDGGGVAWCGEMKKNSAFSSHHRQMK